MRADACSGQERPQRLKAQVHIGAGRTNPGATLGPLARRPAKERKAAAVAAAVMGVPWPGASTRGSSLASRATDWVAAAQFQVEMRGGPEIVCWPGSRPHSDLAFAVSRASPVISTLSLGRK